MGLFDKPDPKKPVKKHSAFENVKSGSDSTLGRAGTPPTGGEEARVASERTYEVKSGDSLSKIAKRTYGDANEWPKIFAANRDTIKDPDLIYPGQILRLPV